MRDIDHFSKGGIPTFVESQTGMSGGVGVVAAVAAAAAAIGGGDGVAFVLSPIHTSPDMEGRLSNKSRSSCP